MPFVISSSLFFFLATVPTLLSMHMYTSHSLATGDGEPLSWSLTWGSLHLWFSLSILASSCFFPRLLSTHNLTCPSLPLPALPASRLIPWILIWMQGSLSSTATTDTIAFDLSLSLPAAADVSISIPLCIQEKVFRSASRFSHLSLFFYCGAFRIPCIHVLLLAAAAAVHCTHPRYASQLDHHFFLLPASFGSRLSDSSLFLLLLSPTARRIQMSGTGE